MADAPVAADVPGVDRAGARLAVAERLTLAPYERVGGLRAAGRYVLLVVIATVVLLPIYTTVVGAFKPRNRVLHNMLVPGYFTLDTFRDAWTQGNLGRYLLNSLIVATVATAGQLITALFSAYAFAYLDFPARRVMFAVFLATLLVPAEATYVVNRRTVDGLGWLNSYQGLIVPTLATAFGTFLMRQVLLSLPRDLRDAARIDGVGHVGFLRHVAVPLVRPTLGALGLFGFLGTWNAYLWPRLITTDDEMNTVQAGLADLRAQGLDSPNLVMAGTVIAALPIVVILLLFQKQLIRGLTAGAVKG